MTIRHSCRLSPTLCLLAAALSAGAAGAVDKPWQLVGLPAGGWADLGVVVGGLTIVRAQVSPEPAGASLVVEVRARHAEPTRFAVSAFDERRQPLGAGCDTVAVPGAGAPLASRETLTSLRLPLGAVDSAAVRYLAAGPVAVAAPRDTSLCAAARGGRVSATSSSYGSSFDEQRILDGLPNTFYASKTGLITNQWLMIDLPGDEPLEIAEIGIDGHGEPNDPKSALRHFAVLASEGGTAEADFHEVLRDECAFDAGLQRWPIKPVQARWLKLLCLDNWGSTQWVELASFECYAPSGPPTPRPELVQSLADFPAPAAPPLADSDGPVFLLRYIVPTDPAPAQPAWRVALDGCREGSARVVHCDSDGATFAALRLDFAFGNLLGGAPQSCAALFDTAFTGAARRVQVTYRTDRPGNSLRLACAGPDGSLVWRDVARPTDRAWHVGSVAVDDTLGLGSRFARLAVVPRGRDNLTGSLWVAQALALYAPAP